MRRFGTGDPWTDLTLQPKNVDTRLQRLDAQATIYNDQVARRAHTYFSKSSLKSSCTPDPALPIDPKCTIYGGGESFVAAGNFIDYGWGFDTWGNPVNVFDPEPEPIPPMTVVGTRDPTILPITNGINPMPIKTPAASGVRHAGSVRSLRAPCDVHR
jgi:hypothetical protein